MPLINKMYALVTPHTFDLNIAVSDWKLNLSRQAIVCRFLKSGKSSSLLISFSLSFFLSCIYDKTLFHDSLIMIFE